jgi:D-glycero-alpha-D-manno-heptose-7-phosphate kinase
MPRQDKLVNIKTLDYQMEATTTIESCDFNGELDLIKAAVSQMKPPGGMDLLLSSDAPPGSGLGTSSAMTVAVLAALAYWGKRKLLPEELAETAFFVERKKAHIEGGRQDQYAAVFGGLNWMEFFGERTVVQPLSVEPTILSELQSRLLLCYTGLTRRSDLIIQQQLRTYTENRGETVRILDEIKDVALQMKKELLKGNLEEFGSLLDDGWMMKKKLCRAITNPQVEELYFVAKRHGALGGRILGAGGGGYFLFFCAKDKKSFVAKKIEENGGKVEDFRFTFQGVQVLWR